MSDITVFEAKRIITMDPGRPMASAVAVRDGRIVSVGTRETMRPWLDRYPHTVDKTFADRILMPGFVDPHTHLRWAGCLAQLPYVGPIPSPAGRAATPTRESALGRIRALDEATAAGDFEAVLTRLWACGPKFATAYLLSTSPGIDH